MRYKNTDRLGVIESDRVITKEINWIFREQPVIDVGIDAIIEEVIKHVPTGRLIAIQIKTGKGNFHISKKHLTYYVSNIHYNYWLGYVLPVLIFAYLPEKETLVWQIISKETLKKARKRWKIEIPVNQKLSAISKSKLTEILNSRFRTVVKPAPFIGDPIPSNINIYSIIENIAYINDSTKSTLRFINIMNEMSKVTKNNTLKIKSYVERGLSENDSQVLASMNKYANDLKVFAKRIENEINIFAESFGIGISAYLQVSTTYSLLTKDNSVIRETKDGFSSLLVSFKSAKSGIQSMRDSINKLPKKYTKLKNARKLLVEAIDLVLDEYTVAEDFIKVCNE
ncbi:MAG: DUF4365 domain-containing protein [Bacteroidales bacterium]|nr:DUF4365 domain-containing protein [Bacteroidales bacterium]